MNTIGSTLRMSIFGESHGGAVGAIVDGFPAGLAVDEDAVQVHLDRRRPGRSAISSARDEPDRVRIESGVLAGFSTGAPILLHIANRDADPSAYDRLHNVPRPGHADLTHRVKYRGSADQRGGGHASGRLTAPMVAAGALAHGALESLGIDVMAQTASVASVDAPKETPFAHRWHNDVRCGDDDAAQQMRAAIAAARRDGDSVGGVVRCRTEGLAIGLGEPLFDSIEAVIAHAMLSIPAVRGVEFGLGFAATRLRGSEHNDAYIMVDGHVVTRTNRAGGAIGGLSNGMPLEFAVAFKPTPSIARPQESVDLETGAPTRLQIGGRHDPCIVPRAVPVVECLTAFVLLDLLLRDSTEPRLRCDRPDSRSEVR